MAKEFVLGQRVMYKGEPHIIIRAYDDTYGYRIQNEEYDNTEWVSGDDLKAIKSGNKYNAVKVFDAEDGAFDSQAEYARWGELKLMQSAGMISDLRRQVSFLLISPNETTDPRVKAVSYKVDFVYTEDGKRIAEEHKGAWTDTARLKAYLFMIKYPHIEYRVTGTQL